MALTVTRSGDYQNVMGNLRKTYVTVAFDSFYPVGGESLTPADFGLRVIDMILVEPKNGYQFEYDYTNSLIKVFSAQGGGFIYVDTSNIANVGTGEDSLISTTLAANALSQNGMGIRVTAWGTTANSAASKVVRGYYGDSSTGNAYLATGGAGSWKSVMEVVRTGTATQDSNIVIYGGSTASAGANTAAVSVTTSTLTETSATSKTIRFTGTSTSDNDIVQSGLMIERIAAHAGAGAVGIEVANGTDLSSLTSVRVIAWGV